MTRLRAKFRVALQTAGIFILAGAPCARSQVLPPPPNGMSQGGAVIRLSLTDTAPEGKTSQVKVEIQAAGQRISDAALFVDEERTSIQIRSIEGEQPVNIPVSVGDHLITVSALVGGTWLRQNLQVAGKIGTEEVRPVLQVPPATDQFELKSPEDSHIATAGWDGLITMKETRQGYTNAELRGHSSAILATAFSPGGKLLASSATDGTVRLWRVKDGMQLLLLAIPRETQNSRSSIRMIGVGISPNLRWIVGLEICSAMEERCKALGRDITKSRLYVWDITSGTLLSKMDVPINSALVGIIRTDPDPLLFSPDSALVGEQRTGMLLHLADGKQVFNFAECKGSTVEADGNRIFPMLTERGLHPVPITAYPPDNRIQLPYEADKRKPTSPIAIPQFADAPSRAAVDVDIVSAAGFLEDGSIQLAAPYGIFQLGVDGTAESSHLAPGMRRPTEGVFLLHGNRLISTDYSNLLESHVISLWNAKTGHQIARSPLTKPQTYRKLIHNGDTIDFEVSQDGHFAAVADSVARVQVFSTANASPVSDLRGTDLPNSVAFSPDNMLLAVGYGGGEGYRTSQPGELPANDGATSEDHSITIWDITHRRKLRVLAGHAPATSAVAWSADGKWIASSGRDRKLKLWDANSGKMLASVDGSVFTHLHFLKRANILIAADATSLSIFEVPSLRSSASAQSGTNILSVTVNEAESRLLTTSQHGSTLWQLSAAKLTQIGTFLLFLDGGYVFYTPDGYYLNSGSSRALAFAVGDRVVPFDEFDLRFNRPDLVLQRIGLGSPELIASYATAYRNRVDHSGIAEKVISGNVLRPSVSIREVQKINNDAVLKIVATAAGPRLTRTFVWVNGVPLYGKSGLVATTSEQSISVPLSAGANHIEVSVVDERGAESIRDSYDMTRAPRSVDPQLHVLAVGVSRYKNGDFNLEYADHDAAAIGSYFEGQRYKFSRVSIDLKPNAKASHDDIMRAINAMRSLPPDDYVVISFAGHGMLDDKLNFYFAPYDMDFDHPTAKGISYTELEDALYAIPARHKVLLLDSCHSGEVRDEGTATIATSITGRAGVIEQQRDGSSVGKKAAVNVPRPVTSSSIALNEVDSASYIEQLFTNLRRGPGASVLSSSSAAQYSYESEKYHGGIFTYELIRCMQSGEADTLKDGEFHVSELRQCVANHVLADTDGKQRPTARGRDPFDQSIAREDYLVASHHVLGPSFLVSPMAAQPGGNAIAWSDGQLVSIVDSGNGKPARTLERPCHDNVFLGYGTTYLVAGCQARVDQPQFILWRFDSPESRQDLTHKSNSHCMSAKQESDAGAPSNPDVMRCDLNVGNWQVVGGDVAPDGTVVLAVQNFSNEKSKWMSALQVWDIESQKMLRIFPFDAMFSVPKLVISPDHSLVAITNSSGNKDRLAIVDLTDGSVLWRQESEYQIHSGFSSNSKQLAVVSVVQGADLHSRLQLIDARSGLESAATDVSKEDEAVSAVAFSPDDSLITISVSGNPSPNSSADELRFIRTQGLTMLRKLPLQCHAGTIKFANAGGRIVTGCQVPAASISDWAVTDFHIWDFARLMKDLNLYSK